MACHNKESKSVEITPSFNVPSKLSCLAARSVIRLLVYEDYYDCYFYRWDPVIIWQFETHQPKKKKTTKKNTVDSVVYGHPPPPWKGIRKLRNWWCEESINLFGHPVESPLRQLVVDALEKQSWTSHSEEEDILFLLLRLCMDTQLQFDSNCINDNWFADLAQIIDNLGPYPLQKLVVGNDVFQGNTLILSTIIQNSPNLQVLRIGQWEMSNDILFSLASRCSLLQEFSIHGMEPDVFMSDDAFFKCFFAGMTPDEVLECRRKGVLPQLSFANLKYVDILFCKQTERLILMLTYFYPNVSLSAFNISSDSLKLAEPFLGMETKMPFLRACGRTKDILNDWLQSCVRHSSSLKELRLHIDDQFPGADTDSLFSRQVEIASQKLKQLCEGNTTVDSLAIRPHEGVDMTKVLLPTFGAHGSLFRYLYFVYDFSSISLNTLYQLLNLCPLLEKLVIDVSLTARNVSSRSFSTALREHPTLETLVLLCFEENGDEQEGEAEGPPACALIVKHILQHAPNLKNLSLTVMDNYEPNFLSSLSFYSVERLQIKFVNSYDRSWVSSLLPSFPNLRLLSLEGGTQDIWSESLESLARKGINVTKKRQEFANVFRWQKESPNSNQSVFIMVM